MKIFQQCDPRQKLPQTSHRQSGDLFLPTNLCHLICLFVCYLRGFLFSCNHLVHIFLTTVQFRGGLSSQPDFCTFLHWVPQSGKTLTPLAQGVEVFACLDWEHKWHPLEALLCLLVVAAVITRITLFSALEQMKKLPCERFRQCPAGNPGHIPAFVISANAAPGSLSQHPPQAAALQQCQGV